MRSVLAILTGITTFFLVLNCIEAHASPKTPYQASVDEIIAVLSNPELSKKFGIGRAISSVSKNGNTYTLVGVECLARVEVTYEQSNDRHFPTPVLKQRISEFLCLP